MKQTAGRVLVNLFVPMVTILVPDEHLHSCVAACGSVLQVTRVLNRVLHRTKKGSMVSCGKVRRQLHVLGYMTPWCFSTVFCYDTSKEIRMARLEPAKKSSSGLKPARKSSSGSIVSPTRLGVGLSRYTLAR